MSVNWSRGSYRGHLGWNPRGELDLMGRAETTAELGVIEGNLVTKPYLTTRADRDIRVRGARERPDINTNPPHQDIQRQRVGGVRGA